MTEQTLNQYAAPRAHVADIDGAEGPGELKLFSAKGRVGRLRYLAYTTGASLLYYAASLVMLFAMNASTVFGAIGIVALLAALWFNIITGIKRCHDMDMSGWWSVTIFIPLIALVWLFVPGTKGSNRFGPPPPANTWGVRILGLALPLIAFIGIFAAIALPAYKDYTDRARAKAAQQQVQPAQQP